MGTATASTTLHIRIAALAAIVGSTAPLTRVAAQEPPAPAAATYQVQLMGGVSRRFAVRATLPSDGNRLDMAKSRPGDVPEVAEAGWPALVQHLAVTDSGGHAVAVIEDGAGGWRLERSVTGPILLRYDVDLAPLAARGWPAPREAAFADAGHLIVIGRSLFIATPAHARARWGSGCRRLAGRRRRGRRCRGRARAPPSPRPAT